MYEVLRFNDQFSFEKCVGQVAYHFKEGEISFAPTYKIKHDSDVYTMKRIPGWTDRIIYFSRDPKMLVQKSYDANNTVKMSDHRPVFAQFELMFEYDYESDGEEEEQKKPG